MFVTTKRGCGVMPSPSSTDLLTQDQNSCLHHHHVVVWLICCHYRSSTLWLTASVFVHPYCVISTFPLLNIHDDSSPAALCSSMSIRRSALWHYQTCIHLLLAGPQQSGGQTCKCKSLWLTEWLSDEVTPVAGQVLELLIGHCSLKMNRRRH